MRLSARQRRKQRADDALVLFGLLTMVLVILAATLKLAILGIAGLVAVIVFLCWGVGGL